MTISPQIIASLPQTALICPVFSFRDEVLKQAKRTAQQFVQRKPIADAIPLYTSEKFALVGPCLGKQAMHLAVTTLAASGVKNFVLMTFAGAIANSAQQLSIAEIVSIEKAFAGRSTEMLSPLKSFSTSLKLEKQVIAASVDSPFEETAEYVSLLARNGASVIEMEASAFFSVLATTPQCRAAAFAVISDVLSEVWTHQFSSEKVKKSVKIVVEQLLV